MVYSRSIIETNMKIKVGGQFYRLFFVLALAIVFVLPFFVSVYDADAYVNVNGYYRKDGTYVRPHVRSDPNGLKYDNYSWTPSQGLYNESYGTRGSEWDTPTYITDPDYYTGKMLYESGQSGFGGSATSLSSVKIYKNLYRGLYNSDVTRLQTVLAKYPSIYPEGIVSGYYGALTEKAVQRFQSKYGIVNYGTPHTTGFGRFGPKTLEKFNQVFGATANEITSTEPVSTSDDSCGASEYKLNGSCYTFQTVVDACKKKYGTHSTFQGETDEGKFLCECTEGYKWNSSRPSCVLGTPALGSTIKIPRHIVLKVIYNPGLSCSFMGVFEDELRFCELYKDYKDYCTWNIVD